MRGRGGGGASEAVSHGRHDAAAPSTQGRKASSRTPNQAVASNTTVLCCAVCTVLTAQSYVLFLEYFVCTAVFCCVCPPHFCIASASNRDPGPGKERGGNALKSPVAASPIGGLDPPRDQLDRGSRPLSGPCAPYNASPLLLDSRNFNNPGSRVQTMPLFCAATVLSVSRRPGGSGQLSLILLAPCRDAPPLGPFSSPEVADPFSSLDTKPPQAGILPLLVSG